jgi:hypothetical protein
MSETLFAIVFHLLNTFGDVCPSRAIYLQCWGTKSRSSWRLLLELQLPARSCVGVKNSALTCCVVGNTATHANLSSVEEKIPWRCRRLIIGTGTGALPVMDDVKSEAKRRKIALLVLPTVEAIEELKKHPDETNAILHVTC